MTETEMKNKLAGRLTLQEAIENTLAETKAKLAAAKGEKTPEPAPEEKPAPVEAEKTASALPIDPTDPEEVEKLAAALDEASALLLKEADSVELGGESRQGGEVLPTARPVGGTQPYKKDSSKSHNVPMSTGSDGKPPDQTAAGTIVPTNLKSPVKGKMPSNILRKMGAAEEKVEEPKTEEKPVEEPAAKPTPVEALEAVVDKTAFSITERGHKFDAEKAKHRREYHENRTEALQKERAVGYLDPDTHTNPARFRDVLRFNNEAGDSRMSARHQAYVEKKHRAGKNAYNPFGGTLTPTEKEEGGSAGMLGMFGRIGKHDTAKKVLDAKKAKEEQKKAASVEPKVEETKEQTAVDYILGKLSSVENGGESKQGGEQLSNTAPVPSNPGRQLIGSNKAPVSATKRVAKAPRKAELAQVLSEPAFSKAHDSKVHENLRNATKGGVKIAAAKALLAKIAAEGCQCGGDVTCRYCKMKKAAAAMKATKAETEKKDETASSEQ